MTTNQQTNGTPPEFSNFAVRIANLESELAEVKAERDNYRQILYRLLPEGDSSEWPSEQELKRMASHSRPVGDLFNEIAKKHGIAFSSEEMN